MNKLKIAFQKFWNNNHISEWELKYHYSEERRRKYPDALPPIGFRDFVLCFVAALILVIVLIIFI